MTVFVFPADRRSILGVIVDIDEKVLLLLLIVNKFGQNRVY